jgi:hypothetical protein
MKLLVFTMPTRAPLRLIGMLWILPPRQDESRLRTG